MLRELSGEGLVVDETHPLQPREDVVDLIALEPRREEPTFQLSPAPRTDREEPERSLVAALGVLRRSRPGHAAAPSSTLP